jgi:hypothetical protein
MAPELARGEELERGEDEESGSNHAPGERHCAASATLPKEEGERCGGGEDLGLLRIDSEHEQGT